MERLSVVEQYTDPSLPYEHDLYGALLIMSGEHHEEDVTDYIRTQETTHLAEGLELQQRQVRTLPYERGHVRGFGDVSMVDINTDGYMVAKKNYLAGDTEAFCLMRRRQHDVDIAQRADRLMAEGKIGDTILVASPYEEGKDIETTRRLGFWPEFRRSYVWLYRKKNAHELECVDISIDASQVTTYKEFLKRYGVEVPDDTQGYDFPGYIAEIEGVIFDKQRDNLIADIKQIYQELNLPQTPLAHEAADAPESTDFLDRYAQEYLGLLVDVHKAIARSLETGSLDDLVRLSTSRALRTLNCLSSEEVIQLRRLLEADYVDIDHAVPLTKLLKAQRYGIWETMSQIIAGQIKPRELGSDLTAPVAYTLHTAKLLDHIYGNTNLATAEMKTMPSCDGGLSFLEQNEGEVKKSIFNGEKYTFDRKMHCVVCDPEKKKNEVYCGPCGICKPCDLRLKSKMKIAA